MLAQQNDVFMETCETIFQKNQDEKVRYWCEAREEAERVARTIEREYKQTIAEQSNTITEQSNIIAEKDITIDEQSNIIAEDRRLLSEKDALIARLMAQLNQK